MNEPLFKPPVFTPPKGKRHATWVEQTPHERVLSADKQRRAEIKRLQRRARRLIDRG